MSTTEDSFRAVVADYVDGELSDNDATEMERHLEQCGECAALARDLKRLDAEAAALPRLAPPPRLWEQVRAGVDLRRKPWRDPWLVSIAATTILFLGGGLAYLINAPGPGPDDEALMSQVADDLQLAEDHYMSAIGGLEEIFDKNQESLGPEIAEMLQQNLQIVEAAVVESRMALATEPQSQIARESLLEGLRLKVSLLQNAILMMNEVRKGDGEGALGFIEKMQAPESPNSL